MGRAEDECPQHAGQYSITHLRMMAHALGFPRDALESCIPCGFLNKGRISFQKLCRLLDMGYFTSALHFTYNMKSGLYNVKLILKCLDLLDNNALSFADIQEAKVAFSANEELDQKGLKSETSLLLKVIKGPSLLNGELSQKSSTEVYSQLLMCGFAVSPQKLSMYLRQKRPTYVESGRVQLYEFLDVLAMCEPRTNFSIEERRVKSTEKSSRGLYQMDDMRTSMLTPDEKLERHLNRRFQHVDSWMLPQETTTVAKAISFSKHQQTENPNGTRPQPPHSSCSSSVRPSEDSWTLVTPVPQLRCQCSTPRRASPILSDQDIKNTQNNIEELLYQMETLDEKSRWNLNWRLDYYLPGYREHSATRRTPVMPQTSKSTKKNNCEQDVFQRLYAPKKRVPSPCHAMTCDAVKLGIGNKNHQERPVWSRSNVSAKRKSLPPRTASAPNK
ncbi:uncharacterized protein [Hyperolius riggenbachi]|uniref:uncharacterized protein isoform X2 n=1 Tax=Hyperolius riggenbachi TaxID=752182 RepID=UPI0035A3957C